MNCPITSFRDEFYHECCRIECEWWNRDEDRCCIHSITEAFNSIKELTDGYKALMVREV